MLTSRLSYKVSTISNSFRDGEAEASLVAQTVKNLPAMQENQVWSLGREDPLEKGTVTHSSILAWKVPWKKSLVGYSPWGCRVQHPWATHSWGLNILMYWQVAEPDSNPTSSLQSLAHYITLYNKQTRILEGL